jgi:hypothetical protein
MKRAIALFKEVDKKELHPAFRDPAKIESNQDFLKSKFEVSQ